VITPTLIIVLDGDDMEEDVALYPNGAELRFPGGRDEQHIMAY
jgi:hypothetical protein